MRKTRVMTMFYLVLSLSFFLVPEFRQGLQTPLYQFFERDPWHGLMRAGRLDAAALTEAARTAEQKRDARTLAFVALHAGDMQERIRSAGQAVAIDPKFTWVYYSLVNNNRDKPEAQKWLTQLQAWDPDNAVPYAEHAGNLIDPRNLLGAPTSKVLDQLAAQADWRQLMEKAFAAPRFDSYTSRRFELERNWLIEHNLARPPVLLVSVASYPIPHLLNLRTYANLLVEKFGKEAEAAGRNDEALRHYWTVAHFGERMQLHGASLIEKLIATALQKMAYERIIPLLRKTGRADKAATLEYALASLVRFTDDLRGKDPLTQSSNYEWTALIVHLFAGLVLVFSALTVLCIVYVNAKRWVRPGVRGRLYQFLTTAENYAPILLFFACLGLYSTYYPYARNFRHYLTAGGEIHNFEPLFYNVLPTFGILPGRIQIPFGNPFVPYIWYALAGIALVVLFGLFFRLRSSKQV